MPSKMKVRRTRLGWTQTKLAAAADLSASDVSRIESGRLKPYPSQVVRLAKALKLNPRQLLQSVD
jgi:transcriptional regulator with XRE-family HTH domain